MIEIKDLLAPFKDSLLAAEYKKTAVREAIKDATAVDIEEKDIEIKNGSVYLCVNPVYRNEIFLRREDIFNSLRDSLGKRAPQRLR